MDTLKNIPFKILDFVLSFCELCIYGCPENREGRTVILQPSSEFVINKPNIKVDTHETLDVQSPNLDSTLDTNEFTLQKFTALFSFDNINLESMTHLMKRDSVDSVDILSSYNVEEIDDFCLLEKLISLNFQLEYNISEQTLTTIPSPKEPMYSRIYVSLIKNDVEYACSECMFDETKVFNAIPELDLKMMTMNVKILDWNRLDDKNDRIIGEVNYSLNLLADAIVTNNKKTIRFEKNIVPIRDTENGCGLLFMSLYLDMGKEEMIVSIIKGKNLKAMDSDNLSDPYCILRLSTPTSKLGTRKTSVKLKTLNPIWNESFPFHVTEKDFANNLSLKVKVYDKDKVGSDVIGEINFSCQSSFAEMRHWKTMISRQREKKPEWHSVRYIT